MDAERMAQLAEPWPEMLILGFSSGRSQLYCTHTHGAAKCLYRLHKPGIIGLRVLIGSHPESPKKPIRPTLKKTWQTLARTKSGSRHVA